MPDPLPMVKSLTQREVLLLQELESLSKGLVWYTPLQIERGDDVADVDGKKGERPWIISRETGEFLYNFVIQNKIQKILELGTSVGYSGLWMGLALQYLQKYPQKSEPSEMSSVGLTTIDHSLVKLPIARDFFKKAGLENIVQIHQGEIASVLPEIVNSTSSINYTTGRDGKNDKKFDLLFFDADRSNYAKYLEILMPVIDENTYLIVDNAIDMKKRLKTFVEKLKNEGWEVKTEKIGDGLLICRKKIA